MDLRHDFAKNKMKVDRETERKEISTIMTTDEGDVNRGEVLKIKS